MPFTRRALVGSVTAMLIRLPVRAETQAAVPDGVRRLAAGPATLRLRHPPAAATPVLAYDGQVPGPVLRLRLGEELRVRLVNHLDQPTSLSWHGVRIDNAMDGVAGLTQKPVMPGESFDYRFKPPDSGLFWYHPNAAPHTAAQIGNGLHGVLIVEEAAPPPVDHDLLLLLADWKLDDAGASVQDFGSLADAAQGRTGPLLTVTGEPAPREETFAPGARLRLRLVSAALARIMLLDFGDLRPQVVAIDGQPCEMFEPLRRTIPLTPGARFDVMLDLPAAPDATAKLMLRGLDAPDATLVSFRTAGARRPALPPIASLPANPLLPTAIHLERAKRVDIVIAGGPAKPGDALPPGTDPTRVWTLNGVASDGRAPAPLFSVKRGTPVTLGFVNRTAFLQQMHVHGHHMRLLHDLDDGWEPYWRDAVLVPEGRTKHAAFVADNPGKWLIEGLFAGLATWFEVT